MWDAKYRDSLVAQRITHLPALQETRLQSLGWEDPLEKEMVTQSSILAWRIPWTEELGGLQSTGSQILGHDRRHYTGMYQALLQVLFSGTTGRIQFRD